MSTTNGANQIDRDEPESGREGLSRDGLAAVAITLVAAVLIVFLVSRIIT